MTNKKTTTKSKKAPVSKKTASTQSKMVSKNNVVRLGVLFGLIAIILGAFIIYTSVAPKPENSTSATQLVTTLVEASTITSTSQPTTNTGFAVKKTVDGDILTSSNESTTLWIAALPATDYESAKANIDKYFSDRSYEKLENGPSGAGASLNYEGSKFSCRVDDWGSSLNKQTGVQEKTLLIACAPSDSFSKSSQKASQE